MEAEFTVGQYVRARGEDMGTGKIELVRHDTTLDHKGQVQETVTYGVTWLDKNGIRDLYAGRELAPSTRSVPKFDSVEEAEAWLEQQSAPGSGLTAQIEDVQTGVAEALKAEADRAIDTLLDTCGDGACDCQDCFRSDGVHVCGWGCACPEQGCPCV